MKEMSIFAINFPLISNSYNNARALHSTMKVKKRVKNDAEIKTHLTSMMQVIFVLLICDAGWLYILDNDREEI